MVEFSPTTRVEPHRFAVSQRSFDKRSLTFSVIVTAGLLSLLLTISGESQELFEDTENLVVFSPSPEVRPDPQRPEPASEEPLEVLTDSPDEAMPQPSPAAIVPAADLTITPSPPIRLSPQPVPEIERIGPMRLPLNGGASEGDRETGSEGLEGAGGTGAGGTGEGGNGSGLGIATTLTARWAPNMDFDVLDKFYPREARGTGIAGVSILKCKILTRDRVRRCSLISEEPRGFGFGQAALRAQRTYKVRLFDQSGARKYNEWALINITARPEGAPSTSEATQ